MPFVPYNFMQTKKLMTMSMYLNFTQTTFVLKCNICLGRTQILSVQLCKSSQLTVLLAEPRQQNKIGAGEAIVQWEIP